MSGDLPIIGFDLDGTLISCKGKQISALRQALKELNIQYTHEENFWELKRNGATTREALIATGIEEILASDIASAWTACVESRHHLIHDQVFDDVFRSLEKLKLRTRLFLLSARRDKELFSQQLKELDLDKLFDIVEVVAPGANAVEAKANRLLYHRAKCYIGDTETDLDAARIANIPAFILCTGQRSQGFLERAQIIRGESAPIFSDMMTVIQKVEDEFFG